MPENRPKFRGPLLMNASAKVTIAMTAKQEKIDFVINIEAGRCSFCASSSRNCVVNIGLIDPATGAIQKVKRMIDNT